eukprot:4580585-Pyramimonas_sp.AAC.1
MFGRWRQVEISEGAANISEETDSSMPMSVDSDRLQNEGGRSSAAGVEVDSDRPRLERGQSSTGCLDGGAHGYAATVQLVLLPSAADTLARSQEPLGVPSLSMGSRPLRRAQSRSV